jgi:predicted nuclease of predicted toxin-antitoxin system
MAFPIRFLIDECLSSGLVELAQSGIEIVHVNHRGLTGQPDSVIARWCLDHDHALITNNGRDFRMLYARLAIHPGLVVILPSITRERQQVLLGKGLIAVATLHDTINKLVEIDMAGDVTVSDWPAS